MTFIEAMKTIKYLLNLKVELEKYMTSDKLKFFSPGTKKKLHVAAKNFTIFRHLWRSYYISELLSFPVCASFGFGR